MKTNSLFKRRFRGRRRRGIINSLISSSRRYPYMSKNRLMQRSVRHRENLHNQAPSTLTCFVWKRIHFDEFRPFVLTNALRKRWKWTLKTLLKVDQNENAYISYQCGRTKTHENENGDRKYRRRVCLYHAHRVQLTSQRAILSISNVFVWTVENTSKQ